jgi:hypothetical protein
MNTMNTRVIAGKPTKLGKPSPGKITILRRGDQVIVHLRSRTEGAIDGWCGTVQAVDAVAIRLAAFGYRFHGHLGWNGADTVKIIPWSRIDQVQVEGRAS